MTSILTLNSISLHHKENHEILVHDLSLDIQKGRTLAIVGESGSGKSLISKAIMGLLPSSVTLTGDIYFEDNLISQYKATERRHLLGTELGLIVQNGMSAFDPLMRIGKQFVETLIYHFSLTKQQAKEKAFHALSHFFPRDISSIMQAFPHQLSGGQLQRVMIAITFALSPKLLIADEPTTALDAPLRREIIQSFQQIVATQHSTLIFISHDLALVSEIADDILVLEKGHLVEYGDKESVLLSPKENYTRYLIETSAKLSARFKQLTGI